MDSGDMGFLAPIWLAVEEPKAVVSSPGEMTVAVDRAWPSPGTACVGLVVVPAEGHFLMSSRPQWTVSALQLAVNACASVPVPAEDSPRYSLLRRAAWIKSPRG